MSDPLAYLGFQLIPPGPLLRPYVRSYWYFRRAAPLTKFHEEFMHPGGGFGIVFNLGNMPYLDGQPLAEPIFLDGVNTVSRRMGFIGAVDQIGISFCVGGAYPFIGLPLAELRDETTALLAALDRQSLIGTLWEALRGEIAVCARSSPRSLAAQSASTRQNTPSAHSAVLIRPSRRQ